MKKVIIGYDATTQQIHEKSHASIVMIVNEAVRFFEDYKLDVDIPKMVKQGFHNYFKSLYCSTYTNDLPEHLNQETRLKLHDIKTDKLEDLNNKLSNYSAPIDYDTMELIEKDYNIYADTPKQIEAYTHIKAFVDTFNDFTDKYLPNSTRLSLDVAKSTNGLLLQKNGKLQVNTWKVKQIK